eukprot:72434-Chlamydomonas_euryale.AAC.1
MAPSGNHCGCSIGSSQQDLRHAGRTECSAAVHPCGAVSRNAMPEIAGASRARRPPAPPCLAAAWHFPPSRVCVGCGQAVPLPSSASAALSTAELRRAATRYRAASNHCVDGVEKSMVVRVQSGEIIK